MSYDEFVAKVWELVYQCPEHWRTGQKVFNVLDYNFGLAREVQFEDGIDCFYDDELVQEFIDKCWVRYNAN